MYLKNQREHLRKVFLFSKESQKTAVNANMLFFSQILLKLHKGILAV